MLQPIILAVSKKTERAYLYEGNHRFIALDELDVDWVPLQITHFFLNNDDSHDYKFVPTLVYGNFPAHPKPSDFGFETLELDPK